MVRSSEDTSPSTSYSAPVSEPEWESTTLEAPKDITPPDGFEVVLHKDALENNQMTEVFIAGTSIALCNLDGEFYAISSVSNGGAPLVEGEIKDGIVTCPYHGWEYDIRTGICQTKPTVKLQTYEVVVEGVGVCVRV